MGEEAARDERLASQKEGYEEKIEKLEADLHGATEKAGFVDRLLEIVEDMDRGVCDMGDLKGHIASLPE